MKFITFQPLKAYRRLSRGLVYESIPVDYINFDRIFAIKLDENTRERLFCVAPSMPQVAIIFETENYEEKDSINFTNTMLEHYCHLLQYKPINSKYKEYIFDKILPEEVEEMIILSESDNEDEVQDDFINTDKLDFLDELSGRDWNKIRNIKNPIDIFHTEKNNMEYLKLMNQCMAPWLMPKPKMLTEQQMDKFYSLVRKYFIKK